MADASEARAFAKRLLSPSGLAPRWLDDTRPQEVLDAVGAAFEAVPAAALTLAEQQGYTIYALRAGERFYDASTAFRAQLESEEGADLDSWSARDANVAGLHSRSERTLFLRSLEADTIVHEFGHVVDYALGAGGFANSQIDKLLVDAYFRGEMLTDYGAQSLEESWAENFRLWAGVRSDALDPPGLPATRRAWLDEQAPISMKYLDNLARSMELALESDPQAFVPGSGFDIETAVVNRTFFATKLGVGVDEISVEDIRTAFELFAQERTNGDGRPPDSNPVMTDLSRLPVYEPKLWETVDRFEDFTLGLPQSMRILGRSDDAERIFGRSGGAILSVSRDAFESTPLVDDDVELFRESDRSAARAPTPERGLAR